MRSKITPPSQTPRKPPTWWLKNAKPASIVSQRVPNISATSALVGGTVDSHSNPITAPKITALAGLAGIAMKIAIAIERRK